MSVFNFCPFFDFAKDHHQPSTLHPQSCMYIPFYSVKMSPKFEKNTAICQRNICTTYIMKKIWQKKVKKNVFLMHVIKNKCNFASVSKTNLFNSYYIQEK